MNGIELYLHNYDHSYIIVFVTRREYRSDEEVKGRTLKIRWKYMKHLTKREFLQFFDYRL